MQTCGKDFSSCLRLCQDFICEHYGEDSSLYEKEIKELMELRQVNKCVCTSSYKTNIFLFMTRIWFYEASLMRVDLLHQSEKNLTN